MLSLTIVVFAYHTVGDMQYLPSDSAQIRWPVGPHYDAGLEGYPLHAWVQFKLNSAAWYIDALESVGAQVGFQRMTGVEMALDGALTSLCGAFDAAMGGLVTAVDEWAGEGLQHVPPHELSKPTHFYARMDVLTSHNRFGEDLQPLADEVRAALRFDRNSPEGPKGWLKQLQFLRNATVHHDTLARHIDLSLGGSTAKATWSVSIDVEGVEPVSYLRDARDNVSRLTSRMLAVVDLVCPNGTPTLTTFDPNVVPKKLRRE